MHSLGVPFLISSHAPHGDSTKMRITALLDGTPIIFQTHGLEFNSLPFA
jgi:hypothetical protein